MNGLKQIDNSNRFTKVKDLIDLYNPTHIIIDCDGTLYPDIEAARKEFNNLLYVFLQNKFGYSKKEADNFISENKKKFNTVSEIAACFLAGIDEVEFNKYVLKPIQLNNLGVHRSGVWRELLEYNIPVILFTNNSSYFALCVAKEIGFYKKVASVFGEVELSFLRKPDAKTFDTVSDFISKDSRVLYFDDDPYCITAGKKKGWESVLVTFNEKSLFDATDNNILYI